MNRARFAAAFLALNGFAFNSLLCRMALRPDLIDAVSFTAVRLGAGAVALFLLARGGFNAGSWTSALTLIGYAITFSLAYRGVGAGVGALILFGTVQATMIGWGMLRGEHPRRGEWVGLSVSLCGLFGLVLPSLSAPPLASAALMMAAGIGWGAYSLHGRGSTRPLADNAGNFLRAAPVAIALAAVTAAAGHAHAAPQGVLLAVISGAVTSGVGYALWYLALPALTRARAAILQLAVPVLAAAGGVILLGEHVTARLAICGVLVLGGVALAVLGGKRVG